MLAHRRMVRDNCLSAVPCIRPGQSRKVSLAVQGEFPHGSAQRPLSLRLSCVGLRRTPEGCPARRVPGLYWLPFQHGYDRCIGNTGSRHALDQRLENDPNAHGQSMAVDASTSFPSTASAGGGIRKKSALDSRKIYVAWFEAAIPFAASLIRR